LVIIRSLQQGKVPSRVMVMATVLGFGSSFR
jgi:hypothetical protein